MSHIASGFCVKDIEGLALTVKSQCPDLQLVRQSTYKTWISAHGSLVGDHPLPGFYQVKLVSELLKKGIDVHAEALVQDVELPDNLGELENRTWSLADQQKLFKNKKFSDQYADLNIGKDSEFVIKYKPEKNMRDSYEIGLVPHPVRKGEWVMMTDFFAQGNGLLTATGLGKHTQVDGVDSWGKELKQAYIIRATERIVVAQIEAGNPEFGSYTKTVLANGNVKIEVNPR